MTIENLLVDGRGFLRIGLTGVVSSANAGQGELLNPEGLRLVIIRSYISSLQQEFFSNNQKHLFTKSYKSFND